VNDGSIRFTGIIKPGTYQMNDFVSFGSQIPGRREYFPDLLPGKTFYVHLPTSEAWTAEMINTVFSDVPDTLMAGTIVVRVTARMVFDQAGQRRRHE
jgi:hypothetical protein